MRVALVHDWLTNLAGAERVLLAMHEVFPEAPIFTSLYAPEALPPAYGPHQLDVRPSALQRLPGARRRWRHLLPWMPTAFEAFELSDYDVVLSSSHACAKGVVTRAETCHVCYCYTPIRYLWEMPHPYLAEAPAPLRPWLRHMQHRLRLWDLAAAQRVDRFVAISEVVRRRIAKHYRRAADVLYPPVDVARLSAGPQPPREDFWLVVSRLVGYKRVDLAVQAFTALGRPLTVVGEGPEAGRLRAMAGPNISFRGRLADADVVDLYRRARGFVFCGEEDFGLTPVEAQATGCPVVAYRRGGATETVIDGETGVFFDQPTPAAVSEAVQRLASLDWSAERCRINAERFDVGRFRAALAALVDDAWQRHRRGEIETQR